MRQGLTVLLSTMTGLLISLPGAFMMSPLLGLPMIALFALVGAKIGYKRRNSDSFFYFSLVCSVALLSMLMYASFNAREAQESVPGHIQQP